jgi:acyl carrier protein
VNRDDLLAHLTDRLGLDPEGVENDTPLFSSGRLDSFSMVDLIVYIESHTGRRMGPGEVSLDNLDTIDGVLRYVEREGPS